MDKTLESVSRAGWQRRYGLASIRGFVIFAIVSAVGGAADKSASTERSRIAFQQWPSYRPLQQWL